MNILVQISVSSMPKMSQSSSAAFSAEHHRLFVNDCAIVTVCFLPTEPWMHPLVLPISLSFSLIVTLTLYQHLFLSHDSYAHMVLCCQCMINFLADLCLHTHSRKLCYVITQSMLEILFTFTPKGLSALGPLTNDIFSTFVYLQKSIGSHLEVRGL